MKIKLDRIDDVLRYLKGLHGFTKIENKSGNQVKHEFTDGLVVNVYTTTGSIVFQGDNIDGDIANRIKNNIQPWLIDS